MVGGLDEDWDFSCNYPWGGGDYTFTSYHHEENCECYTGHEYRPSYSLVSYISSGNHRPAHHIYCYVREPCISHAVCPRPIMPHILLIVSEIPSTMISAMSPRAAMLMIIVRVRATSATIATIGESLSLILHWSVPK